MRNKSLFISRALFDITAGIYFAHRLIALSEHGFTTNEAMQLASITMILGAILNIPSGIFSDKFGHKLSTLIGFTMKFVGFFIVSVIHNKLSAFFGFSLYVVGWCFTDGAFRSWIIYPYRDNKKQLNNINLTLAEITSWGILLGAIIGSLSYDFNIMFPWYLGSIFMLISTCLLITTPGPQKTNPIASNFLQSFKDLPQAFSVLLKDRLILNYSMIDLFIYASFGFFSSSSYPYFNEIFPESFLARVGILQLAISGGRILGNHLVSYINKKNKLLNFANSLFFVFPTFNALILLIPLLGYSPFIFLALIFVRSIILSFYAPKIETILDIIVKPHEKIRASTYSMVEIVRDGSSAIAMLIASYLGSFPYKGIWLACFIACILHSISIYRSKSLTKYLKEL